MLPIDFSVGDDRSGVLTGFISRVPPDWKHRMMLCDDKPWTYITPSMAHFHSSMKEALDRGSEINAPHPLLLKLLESMGTEGHPVDWSSIGSEDLRREIMPHQVDAINRIVERMGGRAFMALPTGTGKSLASAATADHYGGCALVIASAQMQWKDEFKRWTKFPDAVLINGSAGDIPEGASVVICTYRSVSMREDIQKKKWTTVIIDESQKLGGNCDTNTCIVGICERARCVLAVSATPMKGRPVELFNTLRCLFPKIFTNRKAYEKRYCDGKMGKFGYEARGSKFTYELEALVNRRSVTCEKTVVLTDLPPITFKDVRITVSDEIKAEFVSLQSEYKTALRNAEEAPQHLRKMLKDKCDAMSMKMFIKTGEVKAPQCVEWFLDQYVNRPDTDKYLVFVHHIHVMNAACTALNAHNIEYVRIDGSVSAQQRHEKLKCMRDPHDMSVRVAVLTLGTSAESLNLACANVVVMFQLSFTPIQNDQAYARAWRKGATKPVEVFRLLADGTNDDALLRIHEAKTKVAEQIFKKLKQG